MKSMKRLGQNFRESARRFRDRLSPGKLAMNRRSGILCLQPFYFMEFTTSGEVFTCCPAWVKFPIGNIRDNTISEIWNSERARFIRRKMYLGEWQEICNPVCPYYLRYKHGGELMSYDSIETLDCLNPDLVNEIRSGKEYLSSSPTVFNLSNSKVCNLTCIMCNRMLHNEDPQLIAKTAGDVFNHLPSARRMVLTGMGDPFARPDTRNLLINFKGKNSGLRFDLITNALLLPKYWERVRHQNFGSILISTDAASKDVYEKIRVGGQWEMLLRSLALVGENRDRFSSVTLNMTVMRSNYRSIPAFVDFAASYGYGATFQRIRGVFGNENFFEMNDTPMVADLRRVMREGLQGEKNSKLFLGDLLEFYE